MKARRAPVLWFILLLIGAFAWAVLPTVNSHAQQTAKPAAKPAAAKPAPYVVPGGKVYARSGYKIVKSGPSTAVVEKMSGGITGTFDCSCTGAGKCELQADGKSATCQTSAADLCIDCRMVVVVNPLAGAPARTMAQPPAGQLPPGTYIRRPVVKKGTTRPAP